MPAHLKTALTQVQLNVPVMEVTLMLGTWQGIYLFEHRAHPSCAKSCYIWRESSAGNWPSWAILLGN